VRGAFEYQGQKCSAASRAYVPQSLWPQVVKVMKAQLAEIKMGPPTDFRNFMNAVIDESAFKSITAYVDEAKKDAGNYEIVWGGKYDMSKGYFIDPTVVVTQDPKARLMREEIRPGPDDLRLSGRRSRQGAGAVRHDEPVRPDRRDLRHRSACAREDGEGAPPCGGQFLRQ
jgi:hypothetical protein